MADNNNNMEYLENHQLDFEEQTSSAEEVNALGNTPERNVDATVTTATDEGCSGDCGYCDCGEVFEMQPTEDFAQEEVVTQDDINWSAIYGLRDNFDTFNDEQMGTLKALIAEHETADTPKARLFAEAAEVYERVEKLRAFLNKRDMTTGNKVVELMGLTEGQIYLMHKQLDAMMEYHDILCARISIFDARKGQNDGEIIIAADDADKSNGINDNGNNNLN